jgi:hypothetical protein
MFRSYNRHKEDYLLECTNNIGEFQKITKYVIENSEPISYCFLQIRGRFINNLLEGISSEAGDIDLVTEEQYLSFKKSLELAADIQDEELIKLLPLCVQPKFDSPI